MRGETRVGPLVGWPFDIERRGSGFALVYRPPFSAFVDEVRAGRGTRGSGVHCSAARVRPVPDAAEPGRARPSEEESMADREGFRRKLSGYVHTLR